MKKTPKHSVKVPLPESFIDESVIETVPSDSYRIKKTNGKTNGKDKPHGREKTNGKKSNASNGNGHLEFTDELDSRELLRVLTAVRHGDFTVRMPVDKVGINGKLCDTVNDIISLNAILMEELMLARETIG